MSRYGWMVFSFGHGGCTSFSLDFGCKIARLKGNAKKHVRQNMCVEWLWPTFHVF